MERHAALVDKAYPSARELDEAFTIRTEINKRLHLAGEYLRAAGVNPVYLYTAPPIAGGQMQRIDIVYNLFNLGLYHISVQAVLDFLDRALGIYESDRTKSRIRTFNPFFYLTLLFEWIANIPFWIIGRAGFDSERVRASLVGRLIRAAVYGLGVVASLVTVWPLVKGVWSRVAD